MPAKTMTKDGFQLLISNVCQTHSALQQHALQAINQSLTVRNWLIGCYIVEFEQNGEGRAKYGARLLAEMAKELKKRGIKGCSVMALQNNRNFYQMYPQIQQTVSVKLDKLLSTPIRQSMTGELEHKNSTPILQTLSAKLQNTSSNPIRGTVSHELEAQQTELVKPKQNASLPIFWSVTGKLEAKHFVSV